MNLPDLEPLLSSSPLAGGEYFIVCGLGRLGQHCVLSLKSFALDDFEIKVVAIDRKHPDDWEIEQLPDLLAEEMVTGDCRQDAILHQAGIQHCRAILIVTSDENVNIETAIAARRLNPDVRLIVRSGKHNLNELLKQKLGNFAAFEPIDLPAASFALAALGAATLGLFKVGDCQLRVIKHQVAFGDDRFENLPIHKLHKESGRLLQYCPAAPVDSVPLNNQLPLHNNGVTARPQASALAASACSNSESIFYQWPTDTRIRPGDTLIYIEQVASYKVSHPSTQGQRNWQWLGQQARRLAPGNWRQAVARAWNWINREQTRRLTGLGFLLAFLLGILGAVLLKLTVEGMTWQAAISSAVILLLGGYGDVFGGLEVAVPIPWWVQVICLLITAISILFVLSVLGLLADRLLSTRFEFLRRRPPTPQANHVVLVGLGRVGQRIAALLYEFRQPFVCLTDVKEQQDFMPQVPLVYSPIAQGLASVNLAQAKSLIVATDDQMLNLEVALTARNAASQIDRTLNLIIRAQDQRFCDRLNSLLPDAKALCVYALSAEAFAGAAFGENILSLFRLANQTVLVTEYHIEAADTLHGKLLAQIAYGYGVVPIAYQSHADSHLKLMPADEIRLQVGDRLIVLATIQGLQKIEWGTITPPRRWQLQAHRPLNAGATYYAGNTLENIAGCQLSEARAFMDHLPENPAIPGVMELSLYDHQAAHLLRKLRKLLPVRLIAIDQQLDPP
ncbi:NAD-binding protein [Leptodesmis sichuanensis]|uniref:NAD-binding protein n=1 Tax=Leptodesmis sichuanensis TaxID=2906798 RepID=UPI001F228DAF|nr:NAD-binding protein [Leptodesmis sichuanensis]UIE40088.1 NAD-binding protein [Leptodesmis sichuanensis A121]